ncbi:unnamed protein product [Diatraea saccharalis]|uniref:Uncharacterized protein n=1 Tax=Diatraea saccharalis TaxID=40085 RepID=A0A9N9N1G7_9NEOP|nr:unnamed protein product [Diatraea saccharalis]
MPSARGYERALRAGRQSSSILSRTASGAVVSLVNKEAKIECLRVERGGACLRCWPARRLDRHGYIDMGTHSSIPSDDWQSPGPSPPVPERPCFLPPAPPQYHRRLSPQCLSGKPSMTDRCSFGQ